MRARSSRGASPGEESGWWETEQLGNKGKQSPVTAYQASHGRVQMCSVCGAWLLDWGDGAGPETFRGGQEDKKALNTSAEYLGEPPAHLWNPSHPGSSGAPPRAHPTLRAQLFCTDR